MTRYRIVTNKVEFAIEELKHTFWRNRPYWVVRGDDSEYPCIVYYKTREEAQVELDRLEKQAARIDRVWMPVDNVPYI